jgi:hypothetical protein
MSKEFLPSHRDGSSGDADKRQKIMIVSSISSIADDIVVHWGVLKQAEPLNHCCMKKLQNLFSKLYLLTPWRYGSCRTLVTSHIRCEVSWKKIFTGWCRHPHAQPPTWRTRISLSLAPPSKSVGMGGPTSSYAAADIDLEFTGAHKPPHPATDCFRQGRDTIEGDSKL